MTIVQERSFGQWRAVSVDWVAKSDGSERAALPCTGTLYSIQTIPSATLAPTDNYDVTIETDLASDITGGAVMDRDTANVEVAYTVVGLENGISLVEVTKEHRVRIQNAGSGKAGKIVLLILGPPPATVR